MIELQNQHRYVQCNPPALQATDPTVRSRGIGEESKNQALSRCSPPQRDGSVLILVIVVLVLLAMMGAAYISVSRMDRIASIQKIKNIDRVIEATVAQLKEVLDKDMLDNSGNFFNAASGNEPYDYPWTNPVLDQSIPPQDQLNAWPVVLLLADVEDFAVGGYLDDAWLASSAPSFDQPDALWPHITNLNGIFLDLPRRGGGALEPVEHLLNNSSSLNSDTNLLIADLDDTEAGFQPLGADADGDGIRDSRWTWAPLPRIGDTMYVMAVRIVDNSSMINANVALSQVDSFGNYDSNSALPHDSPRWWYPSELDLGGYIYSFSGPSDDLIEEDLKPLLDFRFGLIPDSPVDWAIYRRADFWFYGPYNNFSSKLIPYKSLTISDERELRFHNGLNNGELHTTIEERMPNLLPPDSEPPFINPDNEDLQDHFESNPRLQITVHSGTGHHRPVMASNKAATLFQLQDLWDATPASDWVDFQNLMQTTSMPFATTVAVPFGNADTASQQYLACLVDYFDKNTVNPYQADDDSQITNVSDRYGMEALPFLTEVYIQGAYRLTKADPTAIPTVYDFEWTLHGDIGYVIEMVNPFSSPVRNLRNIQLVVNGSIWESAKGSSLYQLLDGIAPASFGAKEKIILFRDSGGTNGDINPPANSPSGYTRNPLDPARDGWRELELTNTISPNTDVVVELQVEVEGGTGWITYSRIQRKLNDKEYKEGVFAGQIGAEADDRLWLPRTVEKSNVLLDTAGLYFPVDTDDVENHDYERYVQRSAYCNTQGLNPIAVISTDSRNEMSGRGTSSQPDDFTTPTLTPNRETPSLEPDKKGQVTNDKNDAKTVLSGLNNHEYAFDDVAIRFVTDLLRVMWIGPTITQTYAEVFRDPDATPHASLVKYPPGNGTDDHIRSRMLNPYADGDLADSIIGNSNRSLPRAALLMDHVTTIPMDTSKTSLIPGRININTVPISFFATDTSLLYSALPLMETDSNFDPPFKIDLLKAILLMRIAEPQLQGRTRGTLPGFASLGELFQLTSPITTGAVPAGLLARADLIDRWARDGEFTATHEGVQVAFSGGGDPIDPNNPNDPHSPGEIDGRTEEVRLAGFLSNVLSTRSDVYTAYVVIVGYPADDFSQDPVESARFMVILDRSNVTNANDTTRVLGFFRVP